MQGIVVEISRGFDKFTVALHARTMKFNLDFFDALITLFGQVKPVQVAPGAIDNTLAVGGRVADVIIFVVSVALNIFAVERARVEIADTFVIG